MDKKLFSELTESMSEMDEIVRQRRAPSRQLQVDAPARRHIPAAEVLESLRKRLEEARKR